MRLYKLEDLKVSSKMGCSTVEIPRYLFLGEYELKCYKKQKRHVTLIFTTS